MREAQQIYEAIGDEAGSALADMLTGFLDRGEGDLESAERRFQRATRASDARSSLPISKPAA